MLDSLLNWHVVKEVFLVGTAVWFHVKTYLGRLEKKAVAWEQSLKTSVLNDSRHTKEEVEAAVKAEFDEVHGTFDKFEHWLSVKFFSKL